MKSDRSLSVIVIKELEMMLISAGLVKKNKMAGHFLALVTIIILVDEA